MGDMMKENQKKRKQLIDELTELRSQNAAQKRPVTGSLLSELVSEEAGCYAESIVGTIREPLLVLFTKNCRFSRINIFFRSLRWRNDGADQMH